MILELDFNFAWNWGGVRWVIFESGFDCQRVTCPPGRATGKSPGCWALKKSKVVRVEMGIWRAWAMAFPAVMPTLSPVKAPGPEMTRICWGEILEVRVWMDLKSCSAWALSAEKVWVSKWSSEMRATWVSGRAVCKKSVVFMGRF